MCAVVGASGPFVNNRLQLGCQCPLCAMGPTVVWLSRLPVAPQSCRPGFISGKQEMLSSESQRKVRGVSVNIRPRSNLAQPATTTGQSRELSPRQNPSFS